MYSINKRPVRTRGKKIPKFSAHASWTPAYPANCNRGVTFAFTKHGDSSRQSRSEENTAPPPTFRLFRPTKWLFLRRRLPTRCPPFHCGQFQERKFWFSKSTFSSSSSSPSSPSCSHLHPPSTASAPLSSRKGPAAPHAPGSWTVRQVLASSQN